MNDEELYAKYVAAWIASGQCSKAETADILARDQIKLHRAQFAEGWNQAPAKGKERDT